MSKGDAFWAAEARKDDLRKAEQDGRVADSMEVRMALMAQFERGEKTLEQVQDELAAIKRNAKKSGKVTRSQAYRGH